MPWSPIARGVLARPFESRNTTREKTDKILNQIIRATENDIDEAIIRHVEEIAARKRVSMATIAIAWCLSKGFNPIIGLGTRERIDEAVNSVKFAAEGGLTEEDIKLLEREYAPKAICGY